LFVKFTSETCLIEHFCVSVCVEREQRLVLNTIASVIRPQTYFSVWLIPHLVCYGHYTSHIEQCAITFLSDQTYNTLAAWWQFEYLSERWRFI